MNCLLTLRFTSFRSPKLCCCCCCYLFFFITCMNHNLFSPDCAPILLQLLTMVIYCLYFIQPKIQIIMKQINEIDLFLLRITCCKIVSLYLFYFIKADVISLIEIIFPGYFHVHDFSVSELPIELSVTKPPGGRN